MASITKTGDEIEGEFLEKTPITLEDGSVRTIERFKCTQWSDEDLTIERIKENNPQVKLKAQKEKVNWFSHLLTWYLPFILVLGVLILIGCLSGTAVGLLIGGQS